MPIYAYKCEACGAEEDHIQRFSDPPMTECASCGGRLHKQITAAAFHLKGSGWYRDGYASAKPTSEGASKSDSGKSDSGKSDSGKSDSGKKKGGSGGDKAKAAAE